jgi:hypothetical protein
VKKPKKKQFYLILRDGQVIEAQGKSEPEAVDSAIDRYFLDRQDIRRVKQVSGPDA